MICKWCAHEMPRWQAKCPRCGKEQPGLSGCGGFYDLMPSAAPVAPKPAKRSPALAILAAVLAVAVLVLAVLLLSANGEKAKLEEKLERLEERQEKPEGELPDWPGMVELPGEEEPAETADDETVTTMGTEALEETSGQQE